MNFVEWSEKNITTAEIKNFTIDNPTVTENFNKTVKVSEIIADDIYISSFGKGVFENINIFEEIYLNKDLENQFLQTVRLTDDNRMDRLTTITNVKNTLFLIHNKILIREFENRKINEEQSPLIDLLHNMIKEFNNSECSKEDMYDIMHIIEIVLIIEYAKFILYNPDANEKGVQVPYIKNELNISIGNYRYDVYSIIQKLNGGEDFLGIHENVFYDIMDDFIFKILDKKYKFKHNPLCNLAYTPSYINWNYKVFEKKTLDKIQFTLMSNPKDHLSVMLREFIKFIGCDELDGELKCKYNGDYIYPIKLNPISIEYYTFSKSYMSENIGLHDKKYLLISEGFEVAAFTIFHLLKNYTENKGE